VHVRLGTGAAAQLKLDRFNKETTIEHKRRQGLHTDTPACDFYGATFERLFPVLVHRNARVREVACAACGSDACRFEIRR